MKGLKICFIVLAAALITFGLSGMALAFHSGGVAECLGCHNIHDGQSASSLLIASTASSTCANASCHGNPTAGSYHILTPTNTTGVPPLNTTPGGDFGWLLKSYTWVPRSGTTESEAGERHGHNIVGGIELANYVADVQNATAPGGDMDATLLGCTSCHDQHGKLRRMNSETSPTWGITGAPIIASGSYNTGVAPGTGQAVGAYRLLRGTGSAAGPGGKTFTSIFNASVPSSYNRSEAGTITKVAYGSGTSAWCSTCHPDMLTATSPLHTHPVDQGFSATVMGKYNAYMGSGLTGDSGFDTLVPYQKDNSGDYTVLKAFSADGLATDATTSDRAMCLSCHRSHASGWGHMMRWNMEPEMIAVNGVWPGTDSPDTEAVKPKWAQGRTTAETLAAYNGRPATTYATFQRSLCNKCHAQD